MAWSLLLCFLALAPLSANGAPWPYNLPNKSTATCHKMKRNINAPLCSAYTCGPGGFPPPAPLQINTSTPEACCEKCRAYTPQLPTAYGGRGCNAWNWCAGTRVGTGRHH